uniref:Uncharacterized protein n=1 Tax=Arundo donax TaxID=35708 RepID=A0A0A9EW88_ARUDO
MRRANLRWNNIELEGGSVTICQLQANGQMLNGKSMAYLSCNSS